MAERKITSLDVAARAGVSQSAVSRVFTPGASVSQKMAERVRAAAEELGYSPNVLARSLITGQSRIIGLVVDYLDNQFYPDALERMSNALQSRGYHILMFMAQSGEPETDAIIQDLLDYQVDGIVAASVEISDGLAATCEAAGIPVVLFNRGQDDPRLSQVTSANRTGGGLVADFLLDAGHSRIAHVAGPLTTSTGRDRAEGFLAGLSARGADPVGVAQGHFARAGAAAAARKLMAGPDPDAIFVGNDHMAFAVMDVLRSELRLDVPGDVSVVGYDDVPLAGRPAYDLTTVRQPCDLMVNATVETLMERLDDPDMPPRKTELESTLVARGSARLPEARA